MPKELLYMNGGLVLCTVIAFLYFTRKAKMKEDPEFAAKQMKKVQNRYVRYYNNLLLRGTFRRIVTMYSSLSAYDYDTVRLMSVQLFERNAAIVILMPIVALVVMQDFAIAVMCAFLGYIYYQSTVEGEMDKIYVHLMEECSLTITSIREKYLETDNIPLAVLYCEKSKYLDVPLNNIYRILTEVDGEERLEEFQRSYPVKLLRTLANVCYIVNENGAVKYENGADSFSNDMLVIRQECDSEVRRLTKQKIAFNSLKLLSLVGLAVMPAAEIYLLMQIPGTASLLKGYYGSFIHAAVVIASMYAYHFICNSCRPSVVNQVDRSPFIDNLRGHRSIRKIVKDIMPKKFKTREKIQILLDDSLSAMDMEYVYTAKLVYSVFLFFAMGLFLIVATLSVRSNFYNNYNSLSFIPQNVTATQQKQIVAMDDKFMEKTQAEYDAMEDADIEKLCKGSISGISDSDANTQMKRLRTKYEGYHGAHWYWWMVVVMYLAGVIGWFMPEISLAARKKLVSYEAAEDISQLQTIMIVLSETKMDVYKALIWLEKQSTIHKAPLRLCHYSYISNPDEALDKLEHISPNNDFKRLIRKLKSSVYTLSLHDAFSDMALDKNQSLTIREMLRDEELESRKNSAKMIAIAPAAIALVGDFIGPVLILGIQEITETFAQLNGL